MFGKKCPSCKKRISNDFEFCPHCGKPSQDTKEDYGLLGKEDNDFNNIQMPFGFNTLFNSLVKELDKQFKELDKAIEKENPKKERKSGISISISSSNNKAPEIKIKTFGDMPEINQKKIMTQPIMQTPNISDADVKKLVSLPKAEANTKVRRLSNKLIYEIEVPGVKSLENVFINELENSIEIKAIAKDKTYSKLIPLRFPIKKYSLKDEKLILELDSKE